MLKVDTNGYLRSVTNTANDGETGKLSGILMPDAQGLSYAYSGALLTQTNWTGAVTGDVGFGYENNFRVDKFFERLFLNPAKW